jgi:hypothetical protein
MMERTLYAPFLKEFHPNVANLESLNVKIDPPRIST